MSSVRSNVCTIPDAAKILGMPERSLRRWLADLLPDHPEITVMASSGASGKRVDRKVDLGALESVLAKRTLALRLKRIEEQQEEHAQGLALHTAKLKDHEGRLAKLETTRVVQK